MAKHAKHMKKKLSKKQIKKRSEVAEAIYRDNPNMSKKQVFKIASKSAAVKKAGRSHGKKNARKKSK